MKTATCGRCGYSDEARPVNGMEVDLPGAWSAVAVIVKPTVHMLLCPSCTAKSLFFLRRADVEPVKRETLERLQAISDAAQAMELEAVRSGADD